MSALDILITAIYFALMLAIGIYHSRQSATSVRSYFLGDNRGKWWMLAASGAASNFDVAGTMLLVSLFYVAGLHAFWMLWSWSFFNAAFLMSYMAVWIRRTGVITAVELMSVRFGDGRGGRTARTAGAILMVTFLVFSIGYAYAGLVKFLPILIPGITPATAKLLATAVMVVTTAYVALGGFAGVVLADVIQLALSSTAGITIGVLVYFKLDPTSIATLHAKFSTDLLPRSTLNLPAGYESWHDFGSLCIYFVISGLLLNMSGAGGHYGEQRFLATRSDRDAAKAGFAWGLFVIPRYVMIVGFVFIATAGLVGAHDPEQILPTVIVDIVPSGLRGLLIAALLAAFMSSFSSTVNAASSMVVCDLIQPVWPTLETRALIRLSYVVTILVVIAGIIIGTGADSIKSIWVWMIAGVIGATLIPNVLRWHWWRFNGWGYSWGIFLGLGTTFLIGIGQQLGLGGSSGWPEYVYAPVIWLASLIGCVAASLASPQTEVPVLENFYRRVRPFGFWGPVKTAIPQLPATTPNALVAANVVLGVVALFSTYLSVFFLIGHYFNLLWMSLGAVAISGILLSQTWYRQLEKQADAAL